tara:strand:- start:655 stop:1302 length:648 start_codon:yes stop_codon:yes gene_type:complete
MRILSHRGFWREAPEKNKSVAFAYSFSLGFGAETDVRDFCGELVISHDIPDGDEIRLQEFLELAESAQGSEKLPLALNIKADGLAQKVCEEIYGFPNLDVFVFDMAVPDTPSYFAAGLPVFTRMSEVEQNPVWIEQSSGVWLDSFDSEWYDLSVLSNLLSTGKKVCLVSPELHGRAHVSCWEGISELRDHPRLMICTDFPLEANKYFNTEALNEN